MSKSRSRCLRFCTETAILLSGAEGKGNLHPASTRPTLPMCSFRHTRSRADLLNVTFMGARRHINGRWRRIHRCPYPAEAGRHARHPDAGKNAADRKQHLLGDRDRVLPTTWKRLRSQRAHRCSHDHDRTDAAQSASAAADVRRFRHPFQGGNGIKRRNGSASFTGVTTGWLGSL